MGCTSSKQFDKQLTSESLSAPLPRSMSMPVYHRPEKQGDSYHMVALTSCSYGVLSLHRPRGNGISFANFRRTERDAIDDHLDFSPGSRLDAKQIIANVKMRPASEWDEGAVGEDREPEIINTWELMEGLEDGRSPSPLNRPLSSQNISDRRSLDRSVSFHTVQDVDLRFTRMSSPLDSVWRKDHEIGKEKAKSQNESPPVTPLIRQRFNLKSPSPNQFYLAGQKPLLNGRASLSVDGAFERLSGATSGISRGSFSAPRSSLTRTNPPSKSDWATHSSCLQDSSSSPLFDPASVATFRKALELASEDVCRPSNDSSLSQSSSEYTSSSSERNSDFGSPQSERAGDVSSPRKNNLFDSNVERKRDGNCGRKLSSKISPVDYEENELEKKESLESFASICPPAGEGNVVLYFTSLRGVRKTYEDCHDLRLILQGMRLHVDERDVWMHYRFKEELANLLDKGVTVPRLFIKGRYIGDADKVKGLHEEGILAKLLEGLPTSRKLVCDGCGDVRFIPCLTCSGSCKLMAEDKEVNRCPDCNENGLIMCPVCT